MALKLKGDIEINDVPSSKAKALKINVTPKRAKQEKTTFFIIQKI